MRPFGYSQGATMVLFLDRVADVDEFAVFEDEEVVFCGEGFEAGDCFGTEVGEDVDVCFYDCDVWAEACGVECRLVWVCCSHWGWEHTVSQVEELLGRCHICRYRDVCFFGFGDLKEFPCEGIGMFAGAVFVAQMRFGRHAV